MGINYENLDETTRGYMINESQLGGHYSSPRLTDAGKAAWPLLLEEGIRSYDDDWIAKELMSRRFMLLTESYIRDGVQRTRKVPTNAAQQLAEGEFNRYYLRGLCMRAKAAGIASLLVYRGKQVERPRPESESKIGTTVSVDILLDALRSNDFVNIENVLGIPGGPNSGLTCRLPS